MDAILSDDEELHITTAGQDWIITWHAPPAAPSGIPHGAAGLCLTETGDIVLISADGVNWDFPAGRPEAGEDWEQTLHREMREEACAEIVNARLLGFARSRCIAGHEKGKVLVRSFWRAEVTLGDWKPEWEITHRRTAHLSDVLLSVPTVYLPVSRRALQEAGLFRAVNDPVNGKISQKNKTMTEPIEAALIVVDKTARTLSLVAHGETTACFPVLVGQNAGAKEREGDGRTPEGCYFVLRLLPDENAVGKGFYKGLHFSYPAVSDAARGLDSGLIDAPIFQQVAQAYKKGIIPPQETALGGYVAIHAGLADDEPFVRGTKGCIVLRNTDMDVVFAFARAGMPIIIHA